jgi:hypothetical protein
MGMMFSGCTKGSREEEGHESLREYGVVEDTFREAG